MKKKHSPKLVSITFSKSKKQNHVFRVYNGRDMVMKIEGLPDVLDHEQTIEELKTFFEED